MVMVVGEFDIVEFDVGRGLSWKGIMGLEALYEKSVPRSWGGKMHEVERHMQGSIQCGTMLPLEVVEEDLPLITRCLGHDSLDSHPQPFHVTGFGFVTIC